MVTPKSCIWYQPLLILHHQQVPINIEFVGFFYFSGHFGGHFYIFFISLKIIKVYFLFQYFLE